MAKPKRMSDMFASSAEKSSTYTPAVTATPYSSEGPTLPIAGADTEHAGGRQRKARKIDSKEAPVGETRSPTSHPALYEPWTLLPTEILKQINAQKRLRGKHNVVPIVFTKNQNVKAGINRLKIFLGASETPKNSLDKPTALQEKDSVIAVSAQGDGSAKLVSIVDVARRVVAPTPKEKELGENINKWCLYTSLASIEVEKKKGSPSEKMSISQPDEMDQDMHEVDGEGDAFEPTVADKADQKKGDSQNRMIKTPVLTIWITKKEIPAFKSAFGEQTFEVKSLPRDD
ncbi:hypothetical protein DE146DRAFT_162880 [Phaeosphaeria sp. MPI-PUGE-AT-0046c]|nr:hypothetical protein DE146DRAFT_162880 [Phaeosphaeria sp. MPI-PUGE-AT-0046c]